MELLIQIVLAVISVLAIHYKKILVIPALIVNISYLAYILYHAYTSITGTIGAPLYLIVLAGTYENIIMFIILLGVVIYQCLKK